MSTGMNGVIKAADTDWQINFQSNGAVLRSQRQGREEASVQRLPTDCLKNLLLRLVGNGFLLV